MKRELMEKEEVILLAGFEVLVANGMLRSIFGCLGGGGELCYE